MSWSKLLLVLCKSPQGCRCQSCSLSRCLPHCLNHCLSHCSHLQESEPILCLLRDRTLCIKLPGEDRHQM